MTKKKIALGSELTQASPSAVSRWASPEVLLFLYGQWHCHLLLARMKVLSIVVGKLGLQGSFGEESVEERRGSKG
jgi:hypothetical protein